MSKTILCDMDSIIADFYWGELEAYRKDVGHDVPDDVLNSWDAKFPNGKDCFYYFSQPGFFRNLKPIPGAHDVLKRWHDAGHQIVILSAATLTNAPGEKFEWLSEHYPWINRDNVIFTKRKELVRGDLLIDDHAANAKAYRMKNPDVPIIGITYPYNEKEVMAFDWLVNDYKNLARAWETIDVIAQEYYELP